VRLAFEERYLAKERRVRRSEGSGERLERDSFSPSLPLRSKVVVDVEGYVLDVEFVVTDGENVIGEL